MDSPRCTIGLLTWNGGGDAVRCVRSVLAQTEPGLEITWIDNASTDGTPARVIAEYPDFPRPCVQRINTGFCVGHNIAFARSKAPYYLALNQDAILAPDYVARLCDWLDEDPSLALVSGMILNGEPDDPDPRIYSAGMAMGRGRFPFELHRDHHPCNALQGRRFTPAVTGAAMVIRRAAAESLAGSPGEVFPPEFFAYFEEVDLALRVARAGLRCGVEGSAVAWHLARGQEGRFRPAIRMHYLKNHWLLTLRHGGFGRMLRELPQIAKGEVKHYLPRCMASPATALRAVIRAMALIPWALRCDRELESRFPGSPERLDAFFDASVAMLREAGAKVPVRVQPDATKST